MPNRQQELGEDAARLVQSIKSLGPRKPAKRAPPRMAKTAKAARKPARVRPPKPR